MSASCRGHKWCMCQICCTRVSISVQSICNLAPLRQGPEFLLLLLILPLAIVGVVGLCVFQM